jgi:ADP-ribose pyrophosphatase YjhB (NUDIX family)
VWLRVPRHLSHAIPWLLGEAADRTLSISTRPFKIHHATQDKGFVLARANNPEKCDIPLYGTHYIRVECVVIEKTTGNLLIIRENTGTVSGIKLVTGSVEPGEYMGSAAEREVREETGIKAEFVGIVGMGHRLRTRFDKDELLVGCLLHAPEGQTPLAPNGGEISYAAWTKPERAAEVCNPMAKTWLSIVSRMRHQQPLARAVIPDFRGRGFTMELHGLVD